MSQANMFDLNHFVEAQAGVYEQVLRELRAGEKHSHWMWFIFPQIAGLGSSGMARRFAISGRAEAAAYLAHEILGARLRECTQLVNSVSGKTVEEIFGYPDDLKFRSSMSLFAAVAGEGSVFAQVLERYFGGKPDSATMARL